jgi:hypothetical protein
MDNLGIPVSCSLSPHLLNRVKHLHQVSLSNRCVYRASLSMNIFWRKNLANQIANTGRVGGGGGGFGGRGGG